MGNSKIESVALPSIFDRGLGRVLMARMNVEGGTKH